MWLEVFKDIYCSDDIAYMQETTVPSLGPRLRYIMMSRKTRSSFKKR